MPSFGYKYPSSEAVPVGKADVEKKTEYPKVHLDPTSPAFETFKGYEPGTKVMVMCEVNVMTVSKSIGDDKYENRIVLELLDGYPMDDAHMATIKKAFGE